MSKNRQRECDIAASIHRWERYMADASPVIMALAMVLMVISLWSGLLITACSVVLWRVDAKEKKHLKQVLSRYSGQ